MRASINLYNGDCMEAMSKMKDNQFDLAIVDPPYGIDRNGMVMGNSVFNKDNKKWDSATPTNEYFDLLFRISKNQIIWGAITLTYHQANTLQFGIKGRQCTGGTLQNANMLG